MPYLDFRGGGVFYNSYLGVQDIDCKNLNLTYVCVTSVQLAERVLNSVSSFAETMRKELSSSGKVQGSICLEFAVHRKGSWKLGNDLSPWERWSINIELNPTEALGQHWIFNHLQINLCSPLHCIYEEKVGFDESPEITLLG
ncbi:unnamed protein product [Protopolystoma xenopodis]|uniref:Autophagy-related protein 101 n=1 Tax=Protopolystoma xenopodis TaxID=117903 RepID=A0A3S5AP54_9PLAT|nr:unnamed protein product [Protopolystoma xenopodis]